MSDAQGIHAKEITVKLVECADYGGKTVRKTVTRQIDAQNTVQEVVTNRETGEYREFPGACRWVVLRRPGGELGVFNQTDQDLWDSTRRGARLWAQEWYNKIREGDTVEIHVGIVQPAGPSSAGRDFEGGWSVEAEDEGRHIEHAPGGPHASDA